MSAVEKIKMAAAEFNPDEQYELFCWWTESDSFRQRQLAALKRDIAIGIDDLERGRYQTYTPINKHQQENLKFRFLLFLLAIVLLLPSQPALAQVSYWPAAGNANDVIGTNNGSFVGGVTFTPGIDGQAFTLNGTTAYVSVPSSPSLFPGTNSFSLEAWIQSTNSGAPDQAIAVLYENAFTVSGASDYELNTIHGYLECYLRDTAADGPDYQGGFELFSPNSVTDGAFHHVVMVRDVAQKILSLYLDGQLSASKSLAAGGLGPIIQTDPNVPLVIGADITFLAQIPSNFFQGRIDEVKYWNQALTPAEIATEYNSYLFQISSAPGLNGVELEVATQINKTYQIQYVTNLPSTNWVNLGLSFQGSGTIRSVLDSTSTSVSKFYRLKIQ